MEKLKAVIGRGNISAITAGTISAVAGVGSIEQIQKVSGTGSIARTTGCGNINGRK
jgi:hypothetical protein